MGLFDIFSKSKKTFKDSSVDLIYELLFCDNIDLYKKNTKQTDIYPWDILFSEPPDTSGLKRVLEDDNAESRIKILAYNQFTSRGQKIDKKELLGVIVEVGLADGLDVLASFSDGTARYINQSGKIIVWETMNDNSNALTERLFKDSEQVVSQIGPWDKPRRKRPEKGMVRISFLVSDGLYFGEGPIEVLFNDPIASPALTTATEMMKFLTEKSIAHQ